MRIHPPFRKSTISLSYPQKLHVYMVNSIETNVTIHSALYVGKISNHGFLIEKKLPYNNICRPRIRGEFENGKGHKIILNIESRRSPIVFILLFLFYILIAGIIKNSEYTFHILIACAVFLYILHWLLFSIDLKKTKVEFENIIRKASSF